MVPVLALFCVYISFDPNTKVSKLVPSIENVEDEIARISWRTGALLIVASGIQLVAYGPGSDGIWYILLSCCAKAVFWYSIIRAVGASPNPTTGKVLIRFQARNTTWCIAPAIVTFALVSAMDPFKQASEIPAVSSVIASFVSLSLVITMVPKQSKGRYFLWIFVLVPLCLYIANEVAILKSSSAAQHAFDRSEKHHPVEALANQAKINFEAFQKKQSKDYTAAYREYQRRYRQEPPPGFEDWYEFAVSHQSPVIDDFDMIHQAISPFQNISGSQIQEIMDSVYAKSNSELWLCEFSGKLGKTSCTHAHRSFDRHIGVLLDKVLGDLMIKLPDVKFLVNHFDEPRVLIPPQTLEGKGSENFTITDMSHRPVWDTVTKYCSIQRRDDGGQAKSTVETFGLPFVADRTTNMDLCRRPEYRDMHGIGISPTTFRLIEGLVPVLSTGSLSAMGDIMIPSPAYIENEFHYDGSHDPEWDTKQNNLYWAGSTTGGFAINNQWRHYHRQRFVTLAQNLQSKSYSYLRNVGGAIKRVQSRFLNSRLFDVAFTRVFQCEKKFCRDQKDYFEIKAWADKNQPLQSRLAFDIDGNGISGRYYQLLASKSAPLKQTLFREWHDDRLMPWVHYIPVSQSMEELPELVQYLLLNKKGQAIAKEVAEQGRDWFGKAFRQVDMSIYMYRLLLELARLQDLNRKAG